MSTAGRSPAAVVLADSFADEREMYATFLRHCGFDVIVCDEPTAALRVARERPVAAVVTRIVHPGSAWDGIELTRRIKQGEGTMHIPVVILTTRIEPTLRAAAEQAGCDSFLVLPSSLDRLESELRRLTANFDHSVQTPQRGPAAPEE